MATIRKRERETKKLSSLYKRISHPSNIHHSISYTLIDDSSQMTSSTLLHGLITNSSVKSTKQSSYTSGMHTISRLLCWMYERCACRCYENILSLHWTRSPTEHLETHSVLLFTQTYHTWSELNMLGIRCVNVVWFIFFGLQITGIKLHDKYVLH